MEDKITIDLTDYKNISNWIDSEKKVKNILIDNQAERLAHMYKDIFKVAADYGLQFRFQGIAETVLKLKNLVYEKSEFYSGKSLVEKVDEQLDFWREEDKKNENIENYYPHLLVDVHNIRSLEETKKDCKFRIFIKWNKHIEPFYLNFKMLKDRNISCFESKSNECYGENYQFKQFFDGGLLTKELYPDFTIDELKEFEPFLNDLEEYEIEGMPMADEDKEVIKLSKEEFDKLVKEEVAKFIKDSKTKKKNKIVKPK